MEIKHKLISRHRTNEVTINIYINFVLIVDKTDIFQNQFMVFYNEQRIDFTDLEKLVEYINNIAL